MDICLRRLEERNKSRFDSYSVRNSVLNISHITFCDYYVHIFFDNLSRNSCIQILFLKWRRLCRPSVIYGILARVGGIWTIIFEKVKCPGVCPGECWSFDLTDTLEDMLMRTYASSRVKRKSFYRKSELHMFLFFSGHIGAPKQFTNMASPYKALRTCMKRFGK